MKKIRGDEWIGVIIHIYKETSEGNSLFACVKLGKMSFFFSFFFYKIGVQAGRTGPMRGISTSGRKEVAGKGSKRVNKVQKLCTHVRKCKNDTCWNYSRNWGGKGEQKNSSMMYLIHYQNFCKYHSLSPPAQQLKKKKKQKCYWQH
jgi:hypothetical protein